MPKPSAEKRRLVSNFEIKSLYHKKFLISSFRLDKHKRAKTQVHAACMYKQRYKHICTWTQAQVFTAASASLQKHAQAQANTRGMQACTNASTSASIHKC